MTGNMPLQRVPMFLGGLNYLPLVHRKSGPSNPTKPAMNFTTSRCTLSGIVYDHHDGESIPGPFHTLESPKDGHLNCISKERGIHMGSMTMTNIMTYIHVIDNDIMTYLHIYIYTAIYI